VQPVDRLAAIVYGAPMTTAAFIAVALLALVGAFQVALAFGAPWGEAAWGGRNPGVLPGRIRVASAIAALLYPLLALVVLASAGVVEASWRPGTGRVPMWILTGFFALGAVANFASRSPKERWWGPVSLAIAICCGLIAVGL